MSDNRLNFGVLLSPPAWLHTSAPGRPAGTHRHCDAVAEAWSSAQRDNSSEHVAPTPHVFLRVIRKVCL